MPCLQDQISSLRDDAYNTRKFGGIEAIAVRDRDFGLEPDFGVPPAALDMNMRRFAWSAFVGEEVIAKPAFAKDDGHMAPQQLVARMKRSGMRGGCPGFR